MATKGSLGIFIDSKMVYAAFVSGTQRSTCAVPVAGVPEDLDFDAKTADAVRTASQQLSPQQKTALLAVPGEAAMVRCFELPALPKKEEPAAVRFEAQKYIPFDLKDVYFDYDTLPDAARKRISVLFYAAKKTVVERLMSSTESAGLSVAAVETLSNSLARSFNQEIAKNSGAIYMLIRTADDQTAEIIIAKDQLVLLSRHVTLAQPPSAPKWDSTPFLAEIRLSFDYFDDIFKGQDISKVYVSSPTREDMQVLSETIHRAFSLPVEAVSSSGAAAGSVGLAVAHGLALRDLPGLKGKKVNLRPSGGGAPLTAAQSKAEIKDFATKILAVAAGGVAGLYFLFNHTVQTKRAEARRFASAYPSSAFTPVNSSQAFLAERKKLLDQRVNFFAETVDRRRFLTLKLNALPKSVPAEIHLISFAYDDDVTLRGQSFTALKMDGFAEGADQAEGLANINRFVSHLREDKDFMQGFSQIKITSAKQATLPSGHPGIRFGLECSGSTRPGGGTLIQ